MAHNYDRRLRVADLLKHELAKLILGQSRDPRFVFVSVTDVEISKDYANAKVFVTILNDEQVNEIILALNKAAGFFRHELARAVNLRTTPKLHFHYDDTIRQGQKISQLLQKPSTDSTEE
ncbi:MAG: 30S ribosome-binding factor RbfA [Gammaproteobacteria bacterium]|nr:30S ribosome-binding factor RbfA [Gammaproteobacteria bacterium]